MIEAREAGDSEHDARSTLVYMLTNQLSVARFAGWICFKRLDLGLRSQSLASP
jgi:hypothetical protein